MSQVSFLRAPLPSVKSGMISSSAPASRYWAMMPATSSGVPMIAGRPGGTDSRLRSSHSRSVE